MRMVQECRSCSTCPPCRPRPPWAWPHCCWDWQMSPKPQTSIQTWRKCKHQHQIIFPPLILMPPIFTTRWAPWPCATPPLLPWPPARLARGGREELRWTNRINLYFRPWRGFSCALMVATIIMATMMMANSGREGSKWTNLYFRLLCDVALS